MKNIILITRENNDKVTHVSVYLCNDHQEARQFCRFVNGLLLEGGDRLAAREVFMNREYPLERYVPLAFDSILTISDRMTQKILRESGAQILAIALFDAKEEIKEHFFRNISKRSTAMLKEDMEYMDIPAESEIKEARELILDIYNYISVTSDGLFDKAFDEFYKRPKKRLRKCFRTVEERNNMVLVFRGTDNIADSVSVSFFETYHEADSFCDFLNELKPMKGKFIYARHAEQMLEYETTKPLLIRFEQILEHSGKVHGKYCNIRIIREALRKFGTETLLKAFKGLDKRSRELIMRSLPIKTADAINESIEFSVEYDSDLFTLSETRKARQKIMDAVNRSARKFERRPFEVLS